MLPREIRFTRRRFLASAAAMTVGAGAAPAVGVGSPARRPIAVLGTVYRPLSCLYHLAGRFLHGAVRDGRSWLPDHFIQSLWVEQSPENDLSRGICKKFGIQRARSIPDALLRGGKLAVNGVLIVAEHGNYPRNDRGQVLYPRAAMFRQVVAAFQTAGATAPVFVARQLSHRFEEAVEMVETAAKHAIPLMAGSAFSSIRTTPPRSAVGDSPIGDLLMAGCGPLESFGFDAMEWMHSMLARSFGRCPGIVSVRCRSGSDVWAAGDRGEWAWPLLHEALAHAQSANLGDVRDNVGSIAMPGMPATPPIGITVEFANGTRGTGLLLNGHLQENVAALQHQDGRRFSCRIDTSPTPGLHHLNDHVAEIDQFVLRGQSPRPIAADLMCTGALERIMQSHAEADCKVITTELAAL